MASAVAARNRVIRTGTAPAEPAIKLDRTFDIAELDVAEGQILIEFSHIESARDDRRHCNLAAFAREQGTAIAGQIDAESRKNHRNFRPRIDKLHISLRTTGAGGPGLRNIPG